MKEIKKDPRIHTTLTNDELLDKCEFLIKDICQKGLKSNQWIMRIPAEPNRDPDLLFSELMVRFMNLESQNAQLLETVESLKCCGNCDLDNIITEKCIVCTRNKVGEEFMRQEDNWTQKVGE